MTGWRRWLFWIVLFWAIWIIGVMSVNPSWPLARQVYVWGWQQSKAWGLDPCRSCPIPDRFK